MSALTDWDRDKMGTIFADDIFKCIFVNEYVWISTNISLKIVLKDPINNIPASVQIMTWHRSGDKSLCEPNHRVFIKFQSKFVPKIQRTTRQCLVRLWFDAKMLLTHWGRDKKDTISQTTFSNVFSSMKMFKYRFKFHWSLFPRVQLTIFKHWFR